MANDKKLPSKRNDVDLFLQKVASSTPTKSGNNPGRLIFAMDATASREPSWDNACQIQAEMFTQTSSLGGLDIQLCYYRGIGEFVASHWLKDASSLLKQMTTVRCLGGHTQISKLLKHCIKEANNHKVNAVVFIGDCMEESVDTLCQRAGELALLGVPIFIFQEGHDPTAQKAFIQIAHISKGAYCPFDMNSASQLKELLSAVAIYAAGGKKALNDFSKNAGNNVKQLSHQMK